MSERFDPEPKSRDEPSIPGPMQRLFEPKPRRWWFQFWRPRRSA